MVTSATAPAVVAGVALALLVTRSTLNIESFMGAIMAIGVAVANAILLVTFAERSRQQGHTPLQAALTGARERLTTDSDDKLCHDRGHGANGAGHG